MLAILFRLNAAGHHDHHDRAHHAGGDALLAARRLPRRRQDHLRGHADARSSRTRTCRGPILALKLSIRDIEAGYGAVRALHGVSLDVIRGRDRRPARHQRQRQEHAHEVRHGHGAADAAGSDHPGDRRPSSIDLTQPADRRRSSISASRMVPEGRRLFPKLTVEENLLLGAFRARGARRRSRSNLALRLRGRSRCCRSAARQLAGSMSGGQQQMLAIARALMSAPRMLLVDEPSVGLSPMLVSHTITTIKELKERFGLTVLMAEQNFHAGDPHRRPRLHHRARRDRVRGQGRQRPAAQRSGQVALPRRIAEGVEGA